MYMLCSWMTATLLFACVQLPLHNQPKSLPHHTVTYVKQMELYIDWLVFLCKESYNMERRSIKVSCQELCTQVKDVHKSSVS